jgi:hypothetical protein
VSSPQLRSQIDAWAITHKLSAGVARLTLAQQLAATAARTVTGTEATRVQRVRDRLLVFLSQPPTPSD